MKLTNQGMPSRGVNLAPSPWASLVSLFIKLPFRGPKWGGKKKRPSPQSPLL